MICNPGERYWMWLAGASAIIVVAFVGYMVRGLFFGPEYPPPKPLTEAEARAAFQALVDAVEDERWGEICGGNRGGDFGCVLTGDGPTVADEYRLRAPNEPPTILRVVALGGPTCGHPEEFVFELQGYNGLGKPYRSEVFMFRVGHDEVMIGMPVYWTGSRRIYGDACRTVPQG